MKNYIAYLILFFFVTICKAQTLAIVSDPDGYVNIRKGESLNSKIINKVYNNDIVLIEDIDTKSGNWLKVAYPSLINDYRAKEIEISNEADDGGYIYANRLIPIEKLPHIAVSPATRQLSNNNLTIKNDSITLFISTRKFQIKNHRIEKDKDGYVFKIDNKLPFGIDGNMPHVEITSIKLIINQQNISIPKDTFNDLYEPNLENMNVSFDKKGNIFLHMLASDGAGYYDVVWVFSNGKLVRRYLDNSNV